MGHTKKNIFNIISGNIKQTPLSYGDPKNKIQNFFCGFILFPHFFRFTSKCSQ
jgi:hypothetical protein